MINFYTTVNSLLKKAEENQAGCFWWTCVAQDYLPGIKVITITIFIICNIHTINYRILQILIPTKKTTLLQLQLLITGPQWAERDSDADDLPQPHDLEPQQHHKHQTWQGDYISKSCHQNIISVTTYIINSLCHHMIRCRGPSWTPWSALTSTTTTLATISPSLAGSRGSMSFRWRWHFISMCVTFTWFTRLNWFICLTYSPDSPGSPDSPAVPLASWQWDNEASLGVPRSPSVTEKT